MSKKAVVISNTNELVRVKPERIVYISSDGNYSIMMLHDRTKHTFVMNLSRCQEVLEAQLGREASAFIRLGRQLIVNNDYIYTLNLNKSQLVMSDMAFNRAFVLQASKKALKQLKLLLESETKKSVYEEQSL